MKTSTITNWNRLRKRLLKTNVILILCLVAVVYLLKWYMEKLDKKVFELEQVQSSLKVASAELITSKKDLEDNKTKINSLLSVIERQDKMIEKASARDFVMTRRTRNLELAKEIETYFLEVDPYRPLRAVNARDIYGYICACQDFEKVYKKLHPEYEKAYGWKTAMAILYIEAGYEKDPKQGPAYELGCAQMLEHEMYKGKRINSLYNMLVRLGYKKETYTKTILAYRYTTKIQVHCLYEHLTEKLKDQKGNTMSAIVAYNSAKKFPEQSLYWLKYQRATSKLRGWILNVETRMP